MRTGSVFGKPLKGHTDSVWSVAYSPDGRHIISGSLDETIQMWDAETGSAVGKPLKGHFSSVSSVAYSPDGRHIISGSSDKTIQIWDAETGSAVGMPTLVRCCTLPILPMGAISSLGPWITQYECGMPKNIWQQAALLRGILTACSPLLTYLILDVPSTSTDKAIHLSDLVHIRPSTTDKQISPDFRALPDPEGWERPKRRFTILGTT